MNDRQRKQITHYLEEANGVQSEAAYSQWNRRVREFVRQSLGPDAATPFERLQEENPYDELALKAGHLEGLLARDEDNETPQTRDSPGQGQQEAASTGPNSSRVFI